MKRYLVALSVLSCLASASFGRNFDSGSYGRLVYPFWLSGQMDFESVLLMKEDGELSGSLLFTPISEVKAFTYDLSTEYFVGKDFEVQGRKVRFPVDAAVSSLEFLDLYPQKEEGVDQRTFPISSGGFVLAPRREWLHVRQTFFSYRFDPSNWDGPRPGYQLNKLPNTKRMLEGKQPLNILFFGDSITEGFHASKSLGWPPLLPRWDELVVDALQSRYGCTIDSLNASVGGTTSQWGMKSISDIASRKEQPLELGTGWVGGLKKQLSDYHPDLVFIAFGMNGNYPADAYKTHVEGIIAGIRLDNPNAEFVLVESMLSNERWKGHELLKQYWDVLNQIEQDEKGVITAAVGPMHEALLKRKAYGDLSTNHVNHPNDFLIRIHAQVILSALIDFAVGPNI